MITQAGMGKQKESKKGRLFLSVFYVVLLVFCMACDNQTKSSKDVDKIDNKVRRGGIYRTPLKSSPETLDPLKVWTIYDEALTHQLYDRLIRFGPYLEILPSLAQSWEIKGDGKVYKFNLNKNARFHDGSFVLAQDVVFTLKRILRSEAVPFLLPHLLKISGAAGYRSRSKDSVKGLKVINNHEVEITLDVTHAPFLTALGTFPAAILPRRYLMDPDYDFAKFPIGSGPFKLSAYGKDGEVRFSRFDEYYNGPANIDEVHYKIYGSGEYPKMLEDFDAGMLEEIPIFGSAKESLSKQKKYQWFQRQSLSLMFYGMNIEHPNLKSPALREALTIAIDRTSFVNSIYSGRYQVARTILPKGMPGYRPLKLVGDADVEMARFLIETNFTKKGIQVPELELVSTIRSRDVEQEMEMMKSFWGQIGVVVHVKYITDWDKFDDYLRSDHVQLYRMGWHADMPDPDSFLYPLFSSISSYNFMQFRDSAIDRMLDDARGIIDPIKRVQMYQEIESRIMYASPLIPIMYLNVNRAYQPYVRSLSVSVLGAHTTSLHPIWLDNQSESQ
ncbi:MAG: ABC transporter substrate-binding protein [Desulfobacterales bacterium]|nr:ABC transporter substrate-binding protein [Desulfobacterales bacterium]